MLYPEERQREKEEEGEKEEGLLEEQVLEYTLFLRGIFVDTKQLLNVG